MSPTRSGNSARVKPRGKFHPGMAKGKEGPPSRTQTSNLTTDLSGGTNHYKIVASGGDHQSLVKTVLALLNWSNSAVRPAR
jgi:hypothetical protein